MSNGLQKLSFGVQVHMFKTMGVSPSWREVEEADQGSFIIKNSFYLSSLFHVITSPIKKKNNYHIYK